jgi:hypothetical protein
MEGLPKKTAKAHRTPLWDGVVSRDTHRLDTWDRGWAEEWRKHCHNHEPVHETQVAMHCNHSRRRRTDHCREENKKNAGSPANYEGYAICQWQGDLECFGQESNLELLV